MPLPSPSRTRTSTRPASGATPTNWPPERAPLPARMPATWVPCPPGSALPGAVGRVGEVDRRDDAAARLDQVGVGRDAGVEDGHGHAAAGQPGAPGPVGADLERVAGGQRRRRDGARVRRDHRAHDRVLVDVEDARQQAERLDAGRVRPASRPVDDRQRAGRPSEDAQQVVGLLGALEAGVGRERRARKVHLDDDRQQPGPVEHARQQPRGRSSGPARPARGRRAARAAASGPSTSSSASAASERRIQARGRSCPFMFLPPQLPPRSRATLFRLRGGAK